MTRSFDAVVIGGGTNGLVAAITLAQSGRQVLLAETQTELGGAFREIEFAPGFRAAPLAGDAGFWAPDVARTVGFVPSSEVLSDPTVVALEDAGENAGPLLLQRS